METILINAAGAASAATAAQATIKAAAKRRQRLAQKINNGIVVLTAAPESARSRDTFYHPYRHNSYLYYLSGCAEAHTALLLDIRGGKISEEIFLCRPPDALAMRWDGDYLTPRRAKRQLDIADTAPLERLPQLLGEMAQTQETVFYLPGSDAALDKQINQLLATRAITRGAHRALNTATDLSSLLDEMRLIKDATEIALIKNACQLTAHGIRAAMHAAPAARYEHDIEAAIIHTYRRGGGQHAFPPIVAGGQRACTLHYTRNNARLQKNKAVLVDSGCELFGYAGDITRTFPADGQWRGAFSEVYAVVLTAQRSALRAAKPGNTLRHIERAAIRQLAGGLRALKLSRAATKTIIKQQHYRRFYMHSIGHWLGLDVHDVGSMHSADKQDSPRRPRRLAPGMVLTIEPGLYIPREPDIPAALAGIGIRIEDNILITKNGSEILTAAAPKTPAEIRAWMRAA